MIIFLPFFFLPIAMQLTAQEASNFCHCDITSAFCDLACCCDKDCSSVISSECFLSKSSIFCLNPAYYSKINAALTNANSNGCYYYNSTNALQQQVVISAKQTSQVAAAQAKAIPLPSTTNLMDKGYTLGQIIKISGVNYFSFFDANGNCLSPGSFSLFPINFGWRMNIDLSCTGNTNTVNLFEQILGKSVPAFSFENSEAVSIPRPDGAFNEVTIYLIIGRYGSNKIQFVQTIKTVGKINNGQSQTLRVRFLDPQVDLQQEQAQPSFFPQIPQDIFFPVHQIAYSF